MVIEVVADREPARIRHRLDFDSLVPHDGESAVDLVSAARRAALFDLANRVGDGWLLPGSRGIERLDITDPADSAWMEPRLTPHPLKSMTDKARLSGVAATIPTSDIHCTVKPRPSPSAIPPWTRSPGWQLFTRAAGHDAMVTHPAEAVAIFDEVAASYLRPPA